MLPRQFKRAGGSHVNPPIGLIINKPSSIFTKYVPGSGVGAVSTANRRAKILRAANCYNGGGCGKFLSENNLLI